MFILFVTEFSAEISTLYDGIEGDLYRLKSNGLLYSSEIFSVASKLKRAMSMQLTSRETEMFSILKNQLPKCVQVLIWKIQTILVNEAYENEHLIASEEFQDRDRRHIFNFASQDDFVRNSLWVFSAVNDSDVFSISSNYVNEFLYPEASVEGSWQRKVFTWYPRNIEESFYWIIEVLDEYKIRVKSATYDGYLYADSSKYGSDETKRKTFAGRPENLCDLECNWILKI